MPLFDSVFLTRNRNLNCSLYDDFFIIDLCQYKIKEFIYMFYNSLMYSTFFEFSFAKLIESAFFWGRMFFRGNFVFLGKIYKG